LVKPAAGSVALKKFLITRFPTRRRMCCVSVRVIFPVAAVTML